MTKTEVLRAVSELKSVSDVQRSKYERNYRIYEASLNASLDTIKSENPIGFYRSGNTYDTSVDISVNVIKSCIDTLTSKIASTKVRPFFTTSNGSYMDVSSARTAQKYFDLVFEQQNVQNEVSEAFRFSAIFDTGVIYVNPNTKRISHVLPWQVYTRPAEQTYGKVTRVFYERRYFPTTLLPGYTGKEEYISYGEYYDIVNHVYAQLYGDSNKVVIHEYSPSVLPFLFLKYTNPIVGSHANSVVDMLTPIQIEIDYLINTVKNATQLTPANTILVPAGSGLDVHKLTNGIGQVISYTVSPNMTSSPITVATPPAFDPQYMKTFEDLKQTAYELVGISQLSATSQKPTGLDSGIALQTMENIESDRFETQLNAVIRLYVDIARTAMKVYDPDEDILPKDIFRKSTTWRDIATTAHKMKLQFSGADAISKDPSVKFQLIQAYAQSGLIPTELIGQLLELPDIDTSYSYMNNQWNGIQVVLDRCIKERKFEIPPFINIIALQKEILNTQLLLFVADPEENIDDINALTQLFTLSYNTQEKCQDFLNAQALQEQSEMMDQQLDVQNSYDQGVVNA